MLASEIITRFELYMDDTTELSTTESLALLNKISQLVANANNWEILKQGYSGTGTGTTLTLPTRFSHLVENANSTSDNIYADGAVVFVDNSPFKVVSWSDRKQYEGDSNKAYIDIANGNLVFTTSVAGKTVEFDYHQYPATYTISEHVWVPDRFADILYHGMCIDDFAIQQSEKAKSYRNEHLGSYNMWLGEMKSWNFKLVQMT